MKETPFYQRHLKQGARMVDFGGWAMPINYGSQIGEHNLVRQTAGMFDVSHMTVVDARGPGSLKFLRQVLANDAARLKSVGEAMYGCMLNEEGGIIDDLIVYRLENGNYRMVVNAATREKDLNWLASQQVGFDTKISERDDLAMLAVQGPRARESVVSCLPEKDRNVALGLKRFNSMATDRLFIARTGYTGEDGFELIGLPETLQLTWDQLLESGVRPCGLGARDTLRLEAGMHLYGQDMDETVTPLSAGLDWTVSMQDESRDFVGKKALIAQKEAGVVDRQIGLVLLDRAVLRGGQTILTPYGEGLVTSGSFSPSTRFSIGLGRVPVDARDTCQVDIRGRNIDARIVKPVFFRNGKSCI